MYKFKSRIILKDQVYVHGYDDHTKIPEGLGIEAPYQNAYNNSTVVIPLYSTAKRENMTLENNSTLKDFNTKTLYPSSK